MAFAPPFRAQGRCKIADMSVERAAEYRRKSQECLDHSHRAIAPDDKAAWLKMAEGWQRLAENAEMRRAPIHVGLAQLASQEPPQTN